MIVVRTELQCKWGRAQEGFKLLGGQASAIKRTRALTDLSGSHDTVILESEVESLDAYFAMLKAIFANPEFKARAAAMGDDASFWLVADWDGVYGRNPHARCFGSIYKSVPMRKRTAHFLSLPVV